MLFAVISPVWILIKKTIKGDEKNKEMSDCQLPLVSWWEHDVYGVTHFETWLTAIRNLVDMMSNVRSNMYRLLLVFIEQHYWITNSLCKFCYNTYSVYNAYTDVITGCLEMYKITLCCFTS